MGIVTNFDELKRLHGEAVVGGAKSGAWINFAVTMIDSFPSLYETAKSMNSRQDSLNTALRDLVAQIELHTDCMDGRIDRSGLEDQVAAAERLVGSCPNSSPV